MLKIDFSKIQFTFLVKNFKKIIMAGYFLNGESLDGFQLMSVTSLKSLLSPMVANIFSGKSQWN